MAILFFLLFLLNSSSSMASSLSFSAEVISWDSPKSPFYNPNATNSLITSKSQAAVISPNWGTYLMRLTVGDPPQKMMAIMDTGSDVTWFQCLPCYDYCYRQYPPKFVSWNSTTYKTIVCPSDTCNKLGQHYWCDRDDDDDDDDDDDEVCKYTVNYADGSYSNGDLSMDQFGMETEGDNDVNLPVMVFGCSHNAGGKFDEEGTGLIGLDMGPLSLISQLGDSIDWVFSHCLGRYDNFNSSGRIFFGHGATLLGTPTPIIEPKSAPHPFYFVNLVDISVDHERLNILPGRFLPRSNGEGGLIMDTGTPMTILFRDVYDELVSKLIEKVTLSGKQQYRNELCYLGKQQDLEDRNSVPVVDLQPWNTFYHWYEDHVCLAIEPTSNFGMSIIGALAQQDMNVGYNLKIKMIYISSTNFAFLKI